jgi:hypothetical protein
MFSLQCAVHELDEVRTKAIRLVVRPFPHISLVSKGNWSHTNHLLHASTKLKEMVGEMAGFQETL